MAIPSAKYTYGTHSAAIYEHIARISHVFSPPPAAAVVGAQPPPKTAQYTYGTHAIAIHDQVRGISTVFVPSQTPPGEVYGVGREFVICEAEQPLPTPSWIVNNAAIISSTPAQQLPLFGLILSVSQEFPLAVQYSWVAGPMLPLPIVIPVDYTCGAVDIYDYGNGSILVAWGAFQGATPTSYNVYVNGVFNQNVTEQQATISGLQGAAYVNGVVIPAQTYDIQVHCVVGTLETSLAYRRHITAQPTSVMLTTPMKRIFPFPNSTMD